MTTQELMECSNETLALWANMLQNEASRRKLNLEAVPIHGGNVVKGRPIPLLVRVLKKAASLPPADLAKVEVLMNGFRP